MPIVCGSFHLNAVCLWSSFTFIRCVFCACVMRGKRKATDFEIRNLKICRALCLLDAEPFQLNASYVAFAFCVQKHYTLYTSKVMHIHTHTYKYKFVLKYLHNYTYMFM